MAYSFHRPNNLHVFEVFGSFFKDIIPDKLSRKPRPSGFSEINWLQGFPQRWDPKEHGYAWNFTSKIWPSHFLGTRSKKGGKKWLYLTSLAILVVWWFIVLYTGVFGVHIYIKYKGLLLYKCLEYIQHMYAICYIVQQQNLRWGETVETGFFVGRLGQVTFMV